MAADPGQPGSRRSTPEPSGGGTVFSGSSPEPRCCTDEELGCKPIRVFVHLAHGFGAQQWQARWDRGETIGLNERLPYGYFWARQDGCIIEYSEDRREGRLRAAFRLGLRLLLGFDLVHAWRNRRGICAAEIVWTATESQYLAIFLLLRCLRRRPRPKVIAQTVWLFDSWPQLSNLKRRLYAKLIADAAVLTVHSVEGLRVARALFPQQRSMFMPFGVKADNMRLPRQRRARHPIRILSAGGDRHRDWATLVEALRGWPDAELRIVAPQLPARLKLGANVSLVHPKTNDQYVELYQWADLVALALSPNLHGSGITVIEEATVFGLPVVATDIGGLRGYFSDAEVRYVPPADPTAMRDAIRALAEDAGAIEMVEQAQRRMIESGLTSRDFAKRHAELSRKLLGNSSCIVNAALTAFAARRCC
jgi:glycosyltransferase involved in cell wall biosynthesis